MAAEGRASPREKRGGKSMKLQNLMNATRVLRRREGPRNSCVSRRNDDGTVGGKSVSNARSLRRLRLGPRRRYVVKWRKEEEEELEAVVNDLARISHKCEGRGGSCPPKKQKRVKFFFSRQDL